MNTARKINLEKPKLRFLKERRTYMVFGMMRMTAGEILVTCATAFLIVIGMFVFIWGFCFLFSLYTS